MAKQKYSAWLLLGKLLFTILWMTLANGLLFLWIIHYQFYEFFSDQMCASNWR